MALIGIYENETKDGSADFSVSALHFNLWIMPNNLWNAIKQSVSEKSVCFHRYYIDVGVRISVKKGTLKEIDIHLPASEILDSTFCDLEGCVLDEATNDLIFGRPVESKNNSIKFEREGNTIHDSIHAIRSICEVKNENGPKRTNRFRLTFKSPINVEGESSTVYLRFRYEARSQNDVVSSKGWGFAKQGLIFDLRINDIREAIDYNAGNQPSQMKPGDEANIFLIHPALYTMITQSPDSHYARLLEPRVWKKYLSTCKPYNEQRKLVITQWRSEKFTHLKPFRIFAQMHKEFGKSTMIIYSFGVVSFPVIVFFVNTLRSAIGF